MCNVTQRFQDSSVVKFKFHFSLYICQWFIYFFPAADTPPTKKMKMETTIPTSSRLLSLGGMDGGGVSTDTSKMATSTSVGMPGVSSAPATQVCVCVCVCVCGWVGGWVFGRREIVEFVSYFPGGVLMEYVKAIPLSLPPL